MVLNLLLALLTFFIIYMHCKELLPELCEFLI